MSNIMSDCCVKGVKHEGEAIGEYKDIGGGKPISTTILTSKTF
jgi:hypothetical protein